MPTEHTVHSREVHFWSDNSLILRPNQNLHWSFCQNKIKAKLLFFNQIFQTAHNMHENCTLWSFDSLKLNACAIKCQLFPWCALAGCILVVCLYLAMVDDVWVWLWNNCLKQLAMYYFYSLSEAHYIIIKERFEIKMLCLAAVSSHRTH